MKFSLLMSVYSGDKAEYLDESIASVVVKQIVKPDEYVIVKDGPVGGKIELVLNHWKKLLGSKFLILRMGYNVGLARALNAGLRACTYGYVARMDADDVSLPERFKVQVQFMKKNPDISLLGSWYKQFDDNMVTVISERKVPKNHSEIVKFSRSRTPFNHCTVLYRKENIISVGGYPEAIGYMEDWWLALKLISKGFRLHNLPLYLVNVRGGAAFMSRRRGALYLRQELMNLRVMYMSGLITRVDFIRNSMIRIVVRSMPVNITELAYRLIRKT